jgi:hypothetical protein
MTILGEGDDIPSDTKEPFTKLHEGEDRLALRRKVVQLTMDEILKDVTPEKVKAKIERELQGRTVQGPWQNKNDQEKIEILREVIGAWKEVKAAEKRARDAGQLSTLQDDVATYNFQILSYHTPERKRQYQRYVRNKIIHRVAWAVTITVALGVVIFGSVELGRYLHRKYSGSGLEEEPETIDMHRRNFNRQD